jgi:hypothetical protein
MDVEQRLRDALHDGAMQLDIEGRGPAAAQRRGRRIVHRRRAVPAAVTVALVGATTVAVWPSRGGDESDVRVGAPGAAAGATGEQRFAWRAVDSTVTRQRTVFVGSDGALYALGTAPGTRASQYPKGDVPQAIYRSTDGVTWDATQVGDTPWITDLAEREGRLYALGTAPAANGGIESRFATSTDGGATWAGVTLPSSAQPPLGATVALEAQTTQQSLAVGSDAAVVSLRTTYFFDPQQLLTPEEVEAGAVPVVDDEGVAIGSARCLAAREAETSAGGARPKPLGEFCTEDTSGRPEVSRRVSWAELGLSGREDLEVDELFVSHDFETWTPVSSPFPAGYAAEVTSTPDGFVAVGTKYSRSTAAPEVKFARSSDGTQWQTVSEDAPEISDAGVVGSRIVGLATDRGAGATVVTSDDGGATWNSTDIAALVSESPAYVYAYAFDTGPLGVAVVLSASDTLGATPAQYLLTSPDGTNWTVTPLADIQQAAGDNGADPQWTAWVAVGTDHIVLAAETGKTTGSRTYLGTPVAS